jgi:hypothetical protein
LGITEWEKLLSRREASRFLTEQGFPTSTATLDKAAWAGNGPRYRKYGRRALYARDDLMRWARGRLSRPVNSTTEFDELRRADTPRR